MSILANGLPSLLAEPALPPLTLELTDGCDQCGYSDSGAYVAQAQVAVRLKSGSELKLCAHDYARNELALATVATQVLDHRHLLLVTPGVSS
jgi:hypothetical protein